MVDLVGEGIPNWIVAVTSIFTLGAAITAGIFAAKAAHYTKEQAAAAHEQVRIGDETLKVALEDAAAAKEAVALQRKEAGQAYRNFAETRLDALAPVVLATATPMDYTDGTKMWIEVRRRSGVGQSWSFWEPIYEALEEPPEERPGLVEFRMQLVVTFQNVSDQVARISVIDPGNGEVEKLRSGTDIIVSPGSSREFRWVKRWGLAMLGSAEEINEPRNWLFNLEFWARDLGMNVRDTYKFNGDLRLFERDGSRLIVRKEPYFPWTEDVATPMPGRTYERLDAEMPVGFTAT